jgi:hypothetical protein
MRLTFLIGVCVLQIGLLSAQNLGERAIISAAFSPKHIVKTNLVGWSMYSINTNYEYKTGNNISVGLLGGYKLPSAFNVNAIRERDRENQTYTGDIEPKGFFMNPYFPVYQSSSMTGFYMELFTRYYNFEYTYLTIRRKMEQVLERTLMAAPKLSEVDWR